MAFIRWWGLGIFVAIVTLFFLLSWMLLPWVLETLIENKLSRLWGAKIELADVSLSLIPPALSLEHLQITNPENPMRNSFEFKHAHVLINPTALLFGQFHIEHARLQGMQWDTERKKSGALEKKKRSYLGKKAKQLTDKVEDLPEPKKLLESNSLTVQRIDDFKAFYPAKLKELEQLRKQLPDSDKLKQYQAELKQLTDKKVKNLADFNQRKEQLDSIKKRIRADRDLIKKVRTEHQQALKQTKEKLELIKQGPKDDVQQWKNKFAGQQPELFKLSEMIMDGRAQAYLRQAQHWLDKLQAIKGEEEEKPAPKIGDPGRFVYFGAHAKPGFWLKRMDMDAQLKQGEVDGRLLNLTWEQNLIGQPTTLDIKAKDLPRLSNLKLLADLDLRNKDKIKGGATGRFGGYQMQEQTLQQLQNVTLASDNVSGDFKAQLQGLQLTMALNSQWRDVSFASTEKANALTRALSQVRSFNALLNIEQGPQSRKVRVKSNLDKQLKNVFKGQLNEKVAEWEKKLKSGLMEKVNTALGEHDSQGLQQQEQGLAAQEQDYEELLKAKLDSYKEQQKDKLEGKLKNKLKDLF